MNSQLSFESSVRSPSCHGTRLSAISAACVNADLHLMIATLGLISFSVPGRDGPDSFGGVDLLALAKMALRLIAIIWFGGHWAIRFRDWMVARLESRALPLQSNRIVSPILLPWFIYLCWAFLSVVWSPLKSVSFGQCLGLAAQLVLAQTIAFRFATTRSSDSYAAQLRDGATPSKRELWTSLIETLSFMCAAYSLMVVATYVISPEQAGLDRSLRVEGRNGLVHPTAAGATSGIGMILSLAILWLRLPGRPIAWLGLPIHLALALLANSRTSMLVTVFVIGLMGVTLLRRSVLGGLIALSGLGCFSIIAIDPGFEAISRGLEETSEFVSRGQTMDQLQGGSGRLEMWQAVWGEFVHSPILGHGYFVTSRNGKLDVWYGPSNHDAHNTLLQTLSTTGIIGCTLFCIAIARTAFLLITCFGLDQATCRTGKWEGLAWLILFMSIWYLVGAKVVFPSWVRFGPSQSFSTCC